MDLDQLFKRSEPNVSKLKPNAYLNKYRKPSFLTNENAMIKIKLFVHYFVFDVEILWLNNNKFILQEVPISTYLLYVKKIKLLLYLLNKYKIS